MRISLIRETHDSTRREDTEVCEIDISMIKSKGTDGDIRIFTDSNGSLKIHVPHDLEIVRNPDGITSTNINIMEISKQKH